MKRNLFGAAESTPGTSTGIDNGLGKSAVTLLYPKPFRVEPSHEEELRKHLRFFRYR